ncbi:MAG: hypothetical protein DRJ97_06185 [Thermoprotei archaeon]|nr:MAG: hypothetical protein DRJ97_06185 [Thermoprotei archaeon]
MPFRDPLVKAPSRREPLYAGYPSFLLDCLRTVKELRLSDPEGYLDMVLWLLEVVPPKVRERLGFSREEIKAEIREAVDKIKVPGDISTRKLRVARYEEMCIRKGDEVLRAVVKELFNQGYLGRAPRRVEGE